MKTFSPCFPDNNQESFYGRNEELDLLKLSLIKKQNKIVIISGNTATGKTSLWHIFLDGQKKIYDGKVQVFSSTSSIDGFTLFDDKIKLIIIDNISFNFNDKLEKDIENLIKKYPNKQFLLVGVNVKLFKRIKYEQHIHLEQLPDKESTRLLNELIQKKLPKKDIIKIASFAKGNPHLLKLIAYYLNQNKYNLDHIIKLINENFSQKGVLTLAGIEIPESSTSFKRIVSDIRIVNKSILDKIRFRPKDMHNLSSRQFEELIAELMFKRGYNVDLTKITRDGGKDLIIASNVDIGNFIYYVECKHYSPSNPVGIKLVRELAGTVSVDRITAGIMITSSYFSPDAIEFSEKIKHQMSLIDYIKLKEWLENL